MLILLYCWIPEIREESIDKLITSQLLCSNGISNLYRDLR